MYKLNRDFGSRGMNSTPRYKRKQRMKRHWSDPERESPDPDVESREDEYSKPVRPPITRRQERRLAHIQHVEHLHFEDDMKVTQFAEAQKARIDAAERKAMRRMITSAPLPPQVKQALLQHGRSVQFADDGREIPSVPLKWVTDAAVAVQFGPLEENRPYHALGAVGGTAFGGALGGPYGALGGYLAGSVLGGAAQDISNYHRRKAILADRDYLERRRLQNAALDEPGDVQLPDFLRGEGEQVWPEDGEMPEIAPSYPPFPYVNTASNDEPLAGPLIGGAIGSVAGPFGMLGGAGLGYGVEGAGRLMTHVQSYANAKREHERRQAINQSLRRANLR